MSNPNELNWLHYQDIQIPDSSLQKQLKQQFVSEKYVESLKVLTDNVTQLKGKAYVSEIMNTLTFAIETLEQDYDIEVIQYLNNLLQSFQASVDSLGTIGEWNSGTKYEVLQSVIYNEQVYINIKDCVAGTLPTDTTYWLYLGLKGEQGEKGIAVIPKYLWTNDANYVKDDLVAYNNKLYVALKPNKGSIPTPDNTDWQLFLDVLEGYIYVGINPPPDFINNSLWFQTYNEDKLVRKAQLKRYNAREEIWEEVYPMVLANMVTGLINKQQVINLPLSPESWMKDNIGFYYDCYCNVQEGLSAFRVFLKPNNVNNILNYEALYDKIAPLEVYTGRVRIRITETVLPTIALPVKLIIR